VEYFNTVLDKKDYGFIAHEVQEVFPFLVSGEKDGKDYQGISYNSIIPITVKEIQELKKENKELKSRLKSLEEKVELLLSLSQSK
jgi:hypothetical protein